jgi:nitrite reductase (NADH) small subunit
VVILSRTDEALVLNVSGRFYALSNICPHAGAAFERGHVTGGALYCPLHGWGFDLDSGASLDDPTLCAWTYPVEIHDEELFLRLPEVVQ